MKTTKHTFRPDDMGFFVPNFSKVFVTVDSFVAEFKMRGDMASADEWDIKIPKINCGIPKKVSEEEYSQLFDHIQAMCINHAQENIETVWKSMGWKGYNHA